MSDVNNELQTNSNNMQQGFEELELKYSNLSKEIEKLESNKTSLGEELKQFHGEFEQINKSVEEILLKLNKLSVDYQGRKNNLGEAPSIMNSMKNLLTNPLRKIAVGTLSTVYAVTDRTMEKASSFRESLEDIVAEAQYANKKKKSPPIENS